MDVRSTFDLALYILSGSVLLSSIAVVGGAILLHERRRRADLRKLLEAFSSVLIEFREGKDSARSP